MPARPPRLRSAAALPWFSLAATLAVGTATAVAVVGWAAPMRRGETPCLDPSSCVSASAADFLPARTSALELPPALLAEGFRLLVSIALGLALLLLAVVGVNLATLLLSRAGARRGGLALRAALGAPPLGVLRSLLRDGSTILGAGLAAGLLLGIIASLLLHGSWPLGPAPWRPLGNPPGAPLAASAALVVITLGCLLWPVRVVWRRGLRRFLPGGPQTTPGPAETLGRNVLAVVQTSGALVLLAGAGLLLRPFGLPADASYVADSQSYAERASRTLVTTITQPATAGGADATDAGTLPLERAGELRAMLSRVRTVAGVTDSSLATEGAWAGVGVRDEVTALCAECGTGTLPKQTSTRAARIHAASGSAARALGLVVRRGRWLSDDDDASAEPVAVVNHTFAVQLFPNGEPIGKEIRFGGTGGRWVRVVGVVDAPGVPGLATRGEPEPAVYLSILQHAPERMALLVETDSADPQAGVAVRRMIASALTAVEVGGWSPLAELLRRQQAPLRWFAMLFAVLAVVQALCAGWGVHVLVAHGVRRRTRELGVRMALGADGRQVVWMVGTQSLRLAAIGVIVGIIPFSGLARLLQLRVGGIQPWDPLLLLGIPACLGLIALFASLGPARRAAEVDPQVPLRAW